VVSDYNRRETRCEESPAAFLDKDLMSPAKSPLTRLFVLLVAAMLVAPLSAADLRTVKGEITDLECSLTKEAAGAGESHAACAMRCARNGDLMVLISDDAVYIIEGSYAADKNAKLLDFVAKKVEAKGTVTERDGKRYLNIAAMMVQR